MPALLAEGPALLCAPIPDNPGFFGVDDGRGHCIFYVVLSQEGFTAIDKGTLTIGLAGADIQFSAQVHPVLVDGLGLAGLPGIGAGLHKTFTVAARGAVGFTAIHGCHDNCGQGEIATMSIKDHERPQSWY